MNFFKIINNETELHKFLVYRFRIINYIYSIVLALLLYTGFLKKSNTDQIIENSKGIQEYFFYEIAKILKLISEFCWMILDIVFFPAVVIYLAFIIPFLKIYFKSDLKTPFLPYIVINSFFIYYCSIFPTNSGLGAIAGIFTMAATILFTGILFFVFFLVDRKKSSVEYNLTFSRIIITISLIVSIVGFPLYHVIGFFNRDT